MNINLFMGLNIKKSCQFNEPDLQISKPVRNNNPAYDKFREIMSDIKKNDLHENNMGARKLFEANSIPKSQSVLNEDDVSKKNEISKIGKKEKNEEKSISLKQLKKIDENLYNFISFIILVNSPGGQKTDNLSIEVKEGQTVVSGSGKDIIINSLLLNSIVENIAAGLEQMIASVLKAAKEESAGQGMNMTIKDAFLKAVFNAPDKSAQNLQTKQQLADETAAADYAAIQKIVPENIIGETSVTKDSLLGIQSSKAMQIDDTLTATVSTGTFMLDSDKNSNLKTSGRNLSLQQSLDRLFKGFGLPEDLINAGINKIIESLKTGSEEIGPGGKDLINLANKITAELSQLSKEFTLSLEEIIARLETGTAGKTEINSHLAKSLRSSEAFEFYGEKFLKPFVLQTSQDHGIGNVGEISANTGMTNNAVDLADVIMQISSKILVRDNPVVSQLEIMLKPESLGAIRIKIEAQGDGVNIKIQTQYSHTEQIISSNLDMLKNNLSEKGVQLKDLSVFMDLNTGDNSNYFEGFSGFGGALNQSNSPKHHSPENSISKNVSFEDSDETILAENYGIDALSNDNNTYGVDILA